MNGNSFGRVFCVTTWGESHGKALGVVIDGCPSNIPLEEGDFKEDMGRRQGGQRPYTTPRKEPDLVRIESGVFRGRTTGTPLSLRIENENIVSTDYERFEHVPRPGHGDFTTHHKHAHRDFRGGGRLSARETAARVAAGVVAKKILSARGIEVMAFVGRVGKKAAPVSFHHLSTEEFKKLWPQVLAYRNKNKLCLPVEEAPFLKLLEDTVNKKDSLGGAIDCWVRGLPPGLGEPVFEKVNARLAFAVMNLPAAVGVQVGGGREMSLAPGSAIRDPIAIDRERLVVQGNRHGGCLGGMTTGSPLWLSVDFHAPTSIPQPVDSVDLRTGEKTQVRVEGRHDVFPLPRAVPVIEAMVALVLVDLLILTKNYSKAIDERKGASPKAN